MFTPVQLPRVAVMGLTLEFYKHALPGFMERAQNQLEKFQAELNPFAVIALSQLCYTQAHVAEEVKKAEIAGVDAILLIPMSYTPSLMTLAPIMRTSLPVVIWNTQEDEEIRDTFNFVDLQRNHCAQGAQDVTNTLVRSGKRFGMESGHYQDTRALKKIGVWLHAARTAKYAQTIRVGLLGHPFQDMGDFGVDETGMAATWGPQLIYLSIPRFIELCRTADVRAIADSMAADRTRYEMAPEITPEIHEISVRLEWGLRQLVKEHHLDAMSMNFRDLMEDGRIPTIPFLGINEMLGEGMGYAGEGNVTVAAHMAQMRQLTGIANFTEIYTIDFKHNRMLMDHMQECNPAMARKDRKVRLVKVDFWAPGIQPYVGMHFTLEPGPVTLTNITTDSNGKFYYITYETEIYDQPPLNQFTIPHWLIQCREPVGDFLTRYGYAGGTHHQVAIPGHCAEAVKKLAYFQGFECRQI